MRQINSHWLSSIFVLLVLASTCFSQTGTAVQELLPGKPIERELTGGEAHTYKIQLTIGQFIEVVIDQRGIDVIVSISGPDGQKLEEVDSPTGVEGSETVSTLVQSTGLHKVEVRALEKGARLGRYEIRVKALREATAEDKKLDRIKVLAATLGKVKSEDEGLGLLGNQGELVTPALWKRLSAIGRPQRPRQGLITHRLALNVAERAAYREGIADSLFGIGRAYHNQNDLVKALEHYQKSLLLSEHLPEKRLLATVLVNIAAVHRAQRRLPLALEFFHRVLQLSEASKATGVLTALQNLGGIYREEGNFSKALENFSELLRLSEERQLPSWRVRTLIDLGLVYRAQGNAAKALEFFQQALSIGEGSGDKSLQAEALLQLGQSHRLEGNFAEAEGYFKKELALREQLGAKPEIVTALLNLGTAQRLTANPSQALESFHKALSISDGLPDKTILAQTFLNLGVFHRIQSNFAESLDYYMKELKLREELGAKPAVANVLVNIGFVLRFQGDYARALEYYEKALKLNEELDAKRGIAEALSNIGDLHRLQGNYARSLEYHRRSLALSEELKNKEGIARALHRMGIVHRLQGNSDLAMDYFQRALGLYTETGAKGLIADSMNTIGITHYENKNYAAALEYFQKSLLLAEQIRSKRSVGIALTNIGSVMRDQGNYAQAMEYFGKTLAIGEAINDSELLSYVMGNIAQTHQRQSNFGKALDSANRSAAIAARLGIRNVLSDSLTTASQAYYSLNELDKALDASEKAISIIESMRSGIGGQEARASYFETAQKSYQLRIDTLMRLHRQQPSAGRDAEALLANERARARSLIEALNEAQADIREGVDHDLLERERSLQRQLNASADQQARLLAGKHSPEQAANLKKEVESLTVKLREARTEISLKSPRYAALAQPVPLKLSAIQELLDSETLLLEYSLGEEQGYLWVVSPNSIQSFELPKRSEIETQVRALVEMLSDGKSWATGPTVNSKYETAIANLSRSLFPSALTSNAKVKRLVIVADGALQYLPFSALTNPKSGTFKNVPLIAEFEIVNLPSASTLAILRRETGNRARGNGSVAVLADPVFEETDQRVLAAISQNKSGAPTSISKLRDAAPTQVRDSRAILERAFRVESTTNGDGAKREVLKISRLPFTRFEAEGILASAPRTQSLKATDFRASRETATSADLSKYRFIHFATHGILNTEHPELSGVILSLVDDKGQPVDGFLRLHEIYNLNLPADLVVLSACQTGLGKEIRGEGLVGLTRGFMYAGAPRVVASLWKVDDAATAELMKRFYAAMLKDNLRPAAALRRAKIEMWQQKRWQAPFYWAAFELQGEWK